MKRFLKLAAALSGLLLPLAARAQTGSPVNIRDSSTGNQAVVSGGNLHVSSAGASDTTGTGNLNASNATSSVVTAGEAGCGIQILSGTLAATVVPEVSYDGGTTWVITQFYDPNAQAFATSLVFTNPNAATTRSIVMSGGASNCRVRVSAFTSGAATANIRSSTPAPSVETVQGSVSVGNTVTVTGTVTANQGGSWTVTANQGGSWTVTANAGTGTFQTNPVGFSSGLASGQVTVTGSAVALASNSVHSACVKSDAGNTVGFYVGPTGVTTGTGYVLYPGDTQCWPVTNTNELFLIDASGSPLAYFTGI